MPKRKKLAEGHVNIAYRYECFPTDEQIDLFNRTFGCVRWMWNQLLSDCNDYYFRHKEWHLNEVSLYRNLAPWLDDVDSHALANARKNLKQAFMNFFAHKGGFPKFKAKHFSRRSYTSDVCNNNIYFVDEKPSSGKYRSLKIPKTTIPLKIRYHRAIPEDAVIKHITICQEKDGKWYISFTVDMPESSLRTKKKKRLSKKKVLGLDYKSDGLFVDSNGKLAGMPKFYRRSQKKLAKEQRKLSKMQEANIAGYKEGPKGGRIPVWKRDLSECRNYQKQKAKVAKLHARIRHQRKDYLEKMSTKLADEYDVIGLEGMSMKNIARSLNLGKATLDNGYGYFRTRLEQKMNFRGKKLIRAEQKFSSSQLCNVCGYKNPDVKNLKVGKWNCPECGQFHNRDINAACNLRDYAFAEAFGKGKGKRFIEPTEIVSVYPAP